MPNVIDRLREQARSNPRRIVFPESQDPRVVAAARLFAEQGLGYPVLIPRENGPPASAIGDLELVDVDETLSQQCATQLFENRKHKGLSLEGAQQALGDPLLLSALLVKTGFVDGSVAGSLATTASVIRAGLYGIGPIPGGKIVSSFFLMQLAGRAVTYSDCGVVPDPDASQLAEIAISAAHSHRVLTAEEPLVAMLSFSTLGSAEHARFKKFVMHWRLFDINNRTCALMASFNSTPRCYPKSRVAKHPGRRSPDARTFSFSRTWTPETSPTKSPSGWRVPRHSDL